MLPTYPEPTGTPFTVTVDIPDPKAAQEEAAKEEIKEAAEQQS